MMNISTRRRVNFQVYLLNHESDGHETKSTNFAMSILIKKIA